jgi:hypothetical protein
MSTKSSRGSSTTIVVQHYGRFAVRAHRYTQTGRMGTETRDGAYLMTDAFVKQAGRWRAVARHILRSLKTPFR